MKACDGTPSTNNLWADYKSSRNKVSKMLRCAEAQYWKKKFTETKDSKSFWKTVNEATGKSKSKQIGLLRDADNKEITNDYEKPSSQGRIQRGWIGWLATPLENRPHAEKDYKLEIVFILVHMECSCRSSACSSIIQMSLANPNFILAVKHSPLAITGNVIPLNPFLQLPQFFLRQFH